MVSGLMVPDLMVLGLRALGFSGLPRQSKTLPFCCRVLYGGYTKRDVFQPKCKGVWGSR